MIFSLTLSHCVHSSCKSFCLKYTLHLCKPVKINSLGLSKISVFLTSCKHFRSSLFRRAYVYVPDRFVYGCM